MKKDIHITKDSCTHTFKKNTILYEKEKKNTFELNLVLT